MQGEMIVPNGCACSMHYFSSVTCSLFQDLLWDVYTCSCLQHMLCALNYIMNKSYLCISHSYVIGFLVKIFLLLVKLVVMHLL